MGHFKRWRAFYGAICLLSFFLGINVDYPDRIALYIFMALVFTTLTILIATGPPRSNK